MLLDNGIFTFRTLFEKALLKVSNMDFDNFTSNLSKDITYSFELCTPYNRVVVDYKEEFLYFLAARDIKTLDQLDIYTIETNVPRCPRKDFNNFDEILEWVNSQNPSEYEGVVSMDACFNRQKIKNPAYVLYNKAHDRLGSSTRACLEMVLLEKEDDLAPMMPPDISKNLMDIAAKTGEYFLSIISSYNKAIEVFEQRKLQDEYKGWDEKKIFAFTIKDLSINEPIMFLLFTKKVSSPKDWVFKNWNKTTNSWSNSFLDGILSRIGY
jgi:hypothetical protein